MLEGCNTRPIIPLVWDVKFCLMLWRVAGSIFGVDFTVLGLWVLPVPNALFASSLILCKRFELDTVLPKI